RRRWQGDGGRSMPAFLARRDSGHAELEIAASSRVAAQPSAAVPVPENDSSERALHPAALSAGGIASADPGNVFMLACRLDRILTALPSHPGVTHLYVSSSSVSRPAPPCCGPSRGSG